MSSDEKVPSSRIGRTARLGGLVAGQSLRWTATRIANRSRTDEDAAAADSARAMATADEIVTQLGKMKGAAMKFGQVLSTIDFEAVPEGEREAFKAKLAKLRDDAPSVSFAQIRKVVEKDLGGKLADHFHEFGEEPVAAASIGQVHRATTHDGADVAVKVQYPGVAEAVETDLRNANLLLPLIRRLAPGLDARAVMGELRDRIAEELDYELEAQNQRAVERAFRGHPFAYVPPVHTELSTRRVLVTEFVDGLGFEAVKALPDGERDRVGEILFRFYYGLLAREGRASGDPHPGNVLLRADGRVCFLDFGLMRIVPPDYLTGERRLARALVEGDAVEVHAEMAQLGYLPDASAFPADRILSQMREATEWWLLPGERRLTPDAVRDLAERTSGPRSDHYDLMRMQTIPPEALLLRRMEGLLFAVLGELRASADWNALALEVQQGIPAHTELGEEEAAWLAGRERPSGAARVPH
ncbi:MAG: AarF/ABC1/UbiB kinase family protein [Solirubrobacterales bacterium]|jgi:predicted unusual protein kinase regulating ubiquinone biosynthesis (AarF/ABC1/UbiB family)|nr:AarF/ABC1/UbiB kinase family protein [Solirubrobacterales bacterium]